MSRRLLRSLVVTASLVCLTSAAAHADPPAPPPAPPPPAPAPALSPGVGWTIVLLSLSLGGAVTGASLLVDCPEHDLECARWTSLGIWGGIGLASVGALAGLLVVTAASRPPRVQVSVTVDRSQHGSSMPRATFAYTF